MPFCLLENAVVNASKQSEGAGEGEGDTQETDKGLVKLTKAEKRAKLKKSKKEAKKQAKELPPDEVKDNPQRAVLVSYHFIYPCPSFGLFFLSF